MKPTDIWTNHPMPNFKPMCRNGDSCHVASPRGTTLRRAKKNGIEYKPIGTTAQKRNATERAIIPGLLCEHIVNICEGNIPELPQLEWRFGDML